MKPLLGAVMLIAGTSIGIGMLTLPAFLAAGGLFYGSLATILVWLVMWGAALAFAELSWNLPIGTNMLHMSEKTLGKLGKFLMCTTYIMLLYALSSAYLSNLHAISSLLIPNAHSGFFILIAAMVIFLLVDFSILDAINRLLMLIMIVSFITLIMGLALHPKHVQHVKIFGDVVASIKILPLLITSFGYHIVVPSVRKMLGNNSKKQIKQALLFGSLIPLVFYLLWFGIMMQELEPNTFAAMISSGQPVALMPDYLAKVLKFYWVKPICLILVCSAIATSWLGVSVSTLDFFRDSYFKKYSIVFTILPPVFFVFFWPNGFLQALQYAGYLVAILLIIFPALMLYSFRQKVQVTDMFIKQYLLFGLMLFGCFTLLL